MAFSRGLSSGRTLAGAIGRHVAGSKSGFFTHTIPRRPNLRDQQTVSRLSVVVDAFWDVCEEQLRQHLQHGVTWVANSSHVALVEMLEHWRDRADPEPDTERVTLQAMYRSATREQDLAQSEGSFEL